MSGVSYVAVYHAPGYPNGLRAVAIHTGFACKRAELETEIKYRGAYLINQADDRRVARRNMFAPSLTLKARVMPDQFIEWWTSSPQAADAFVADYNQPGGNLS